MQSISVFLDITKIAVFRWKNADLSRTQAVFHVIYKFFRSYLGKRFHYCRIFVTEFRFGWGGGAFWHSSIHEQPQKGPFWIGLKYFFFLIFLLWLNSQNNSFRLSLLLISLSCILYISTIINIVRTNWGGWGGGGWKISNLALLGGRRLGNFQNKWGKTLLGGWKITGGCI